MQTSLDVISNKKENRCGYISGILFNASNRETVLKWALLPGSITY